MSNKKKTILQMQTITESNNYSIINITNPEDGNNSLLLNLSIRSINIDKTNKSDLFVDNSSRPLKGTSISYMLVHINLKVEKNDLTSCYYYRISDDGLAVDPSTYIPANMNSNVDYINISYVARCNNAQSFLLRLYLYDQNNQQTMNGHVTGTYTYYGLW